MSPRRRRKNSGWSRKASKQQRKDEEPTKTREVMTKAELKDWTKQYESSGALDRFLREYCEDDKDDALLEDF